MNNIPLKLLVVTYAPTILFEGKLQSYPPYVNEMDVWFKCADKVKILAPFGYPTKVFLKPFENKNIDRLYIPFVSFHTFRNIVLSVFQIPYIIIQLFRGMFWANHIHFRCPGNVSLLGCIIQIFFPSIAKSTKYAGNWDPNSNQPWSYRLQQAILRNTFLTRNMKVLVYGEWPNETNNIHPFISATYTEAEKLPFVKRDYSQPLEFVFAGALVVGKRPLLAVQVIESLNKRGILAVLHMYGDGPLMLELQSYILEHQLEAYVILYGNQDRTVVKERLINAHFNILPSKSEGWPKAVAEGMFFGCIPVATSVSCVSWMLGEGKRGILIAPDLEQAVSKIIDTLTHKDLDAMAEAALTWSQQYTFDRLEADIKAVLEGRF